MRSQHFGKLPTLVAVAITCMVPAAFSQMGAGRGMGQKPVNRLYDPTTEVTVKGTVDEVKTFSGRRGLWSGIHLALQTESGTFDVHLGPASYLKAEGFEFAKGDEAEVTGSKVRYQGQDSIIAREVKLNGKSLTLRDTQGVPKWSGGRGWKPAPPAR